MNKKTRGKKYRIKDKSKTVHKTYHTQFCTHTKSKLEKHTSPIKLSINLQRFVSIKCAILLRLTHTFRYSTLLLTILEGR